MPSKGSGDLSLKNLVEEVMRTQRPATVRQLVNAVRREMFEVSAEEVVQVVKELRAEGKIELLRQVPIFGSFVGYLRTSWSLSFWLVLVVTLLTLISIRLAPDTYPWVVPRWVLGTIFTVFVPGYTFVEALFPRRRELDSVERFSLSIGLSLALVPLVGLLLNYTPWGIRLDPIIASLSTLVVAFALTGAYRRYLQLTRTA